MLALQGDLMDGLASCVLTIMLSGQLEMPVEQSWEIRILYCIAVNLGV